jgi:hypothetical protein
MGLGILGNGLSHYLIPEPRCVILQEVAAKKRVEVVKLASKSETFDECGSCQ